MHYKVCFFMFSNIYAYFHKPIGQLMLRLRTANFKGNKEGLGHTD